VHRSLASRLVCTAACLVVTQVRGAGFDPVQSTAEPVRPAAGLQPVPPIPASTAALRRKAAEATRLPVDRRLLRAVSDVHQIITRKPWVPTRTSREEGAWLLSHGEHPVGRIGDTADFPEMLSLLVAWARTLLAQDPVQGHPAAERSPQDLPLLHSSALQTLARAEARWASSRSRRSLGVAARAAASLAFQTIDFLEIADAMMARALALVAVEQAALGAADVEAEALVAHALGYTKAARALAETLPDSSPLRAFLVGNDVQLETLARTPQASESARYLWLRRLATRGREDPANAWWALAFPNDGARAPLIATRLAVAAFSSRFELGEQLAVLAAVEAARLGGDRRAAQLHERLDRTRARAPDVVVAVRAARAVLTRRAGLVQRFESDLARVRTRGKLFGDEAVICFLSALFYGGLEEQSRFLLYQKVVPDQARDFARSLGPVDNLRSREFREWVETLADAKRGEPVARRLIAGLEGWPTLGERALVPVVDALEGMLPYGEPARFSAVRRFVARLDARPYDRSVLGTAAFIYLDDLAWAGQAIRSELALTLDPTNERWLAEFVGDRETLLHLLKSPDRSPADKAEIVVSLLNLGWGAAAAEEELRNLLAAHPADVQVRWRLREFLVDRRRLAEARSLIVDWLARDEAQGLEQIEAHVQLARISFLEEDYERAWADIEPSLSREKGDALRWGARIEARRGRKAQAIALAEHAAERYPGPTSSIELARVLWTTGEPEAAASRLAEARPPGLFNHWSELCEAFSDVFAEGDPSQGLRAFEALQRAPAPALLLDRLAWDIERRGSVELAFNMFSRVHATGVDELRNLVRAYRALKQLRGEPDALAWLRARIAQIDRPRWDALSQIAFYWRTPEVLWAIVPLDQEIASIPWLMRALSFARDGAPEPQRKALEAYYSRKGLFLGARRTLGRYLLDLASEEEMLAVANRGSEGLWAATALGIRAEADGRYEDANTCYHAAVDTEQRNSEVYWWVRDRLDAWRRRGISLGRIAQESATRMLPAGPYDD